MFQLPWRMPGKHEAVDPCFKKAAHTFPNFQKKRWVRKAKNKNLNNKLMINIINFLHIFLTIIICVKAAK